MSEAERNFPLSQSIAIFLQCVMEKMEINALRTAEQCDIRKWLAKRLSC